MSMCFVRWCWCSFLARRIALRLSTWRAGGGRRRGKEEEEEEEEERAAAAAAASECLCVFVPLIMSSNISFMNVCTHATACAAAASATYSASHDDSATLSCFLLDQSTMLFPI